MGGLVMWTESELEHISKVQLLEYHIRKRMSWNLQSAKSRCKDSDIPFDIEVEDLLPFPLYCPVLGIQLDWLADSRSGVDNSPSLDRLDPKTGYVRGNVMIISNRANRIKNDASLEEVMQVARWLEKQKDAQEERPEYNPYRQLELYEGLQK
jgi:hypothetical protein